MYCEITAGDKNEKADQKKINLILTLTVSSFKKLPFTDILKTFLSKKHCV
jgi:hypothetical protein